MEKTKQCKVPIVLVGESLNQYDNKIQFPDKLEKANEMLRKVGLPKQVAYNERVAKTVPPKSTSTST